MHDNKDEAPTYLTGLGACTIGLIQIPNNRLALIQLCRRLGVPIHQKGELHFATSLHHLLPNNGAATVIFLDPLDG